MFNGIISSQDVTKVVLEMAMNTRNKSAQRRQFAVLRLTCKLWKNIGESLRSKGALLMPLSGQLHSLARLLRSAFGSRSTQDRVVTLPVDS